MAKLTVASLREMKANGQKITLSICHDYQIARILDRAGVDVLTLGDSVGMVTLGHESRSQITLDHMIVICSAIRRATERAIVNCDMPFGPAEEGWREALKAAVRLVKEGGAEMIKIDDAITHMEAVKAIAHAGIAVYPRFSPLATLPIGKFETRDEWEHSVRENALAQDLVGQQKDRIFEQAQQLEAAGASALGADVTPDMYAEIAKLVSIPLLGGRGPESDGLYLHGVSIRAAGVDQRPSPANFGRLIYDVAMGELTDIRAGKANFVHSDSR